jgi:acyl-CoA-dependent ceramide synthase
LNLFWLYCLFRSAYRLVVYKIAKDDRSEAEVSETEDLVTTKGGIVTDANTEAMPRLNANGFANGRAESVVKASGIERVRDK